MDSLIQDIYSAKWWIEVVVAGILINLISAYLKAPTDDFFGKFSKRWATRTEKNRTARNTRINKLKNNPNLQTVTLLKAVDQRIRAVFYTIWVAFYWTLAALSVLQNLGSFVILFLGIFIVAAGLIAANLLNDATNKFSEVSEARSED